MLFYMAGRQVLLYWCSGYVQGERFYNSAMLVVHVLLVVLHNGSKHMGIIWPHFLGLVRANNVQP